MLESLGLGQRKGEVPRNKGLVVLAGALVITVVALLCAGSRTLAWIWVDDNTLVEDITLVGTGDLSGTTFSDLKIARDGAGNAMAIWQAGTPLNLVGAAAYTLGSGWSSLGTILQGGSPFDISMNASGDTIIVASDLVGDTINALAGGNPAEVIATGVMNLANGKLKAAISGNGDALVVWLDDAEIRYRLFRNGSFEPETLLDSDSFTIAGLDVAADDVGNFMVLWNGTDQPEIISRRLIGGVLNARETVGAPTGLGVEAAPQVAMYGNQMAIAVWEHIKTDPVGGGTVRGIAANHFDGTSWGTQVDIDAGIAAGTVARFPHVAVQADGTAMAVWQQATAVFDQLIYANRFAGGVWEGAVQIGCDVVGETFNIDMDGFGNAAAAFSTGDAVIVRVFADGLGWLDTFPTDGTAGCSTQGSNVYSAISLATRDGLEKNVVITPHEVLTVFQRSVSLLPNNVYGARGHKDVYINGFDLETASPTVSLDVTLPFNDRCGEISPFFYTEMRFSNDGVTWSLWEPTPTSGPPFTTTKTGWDLTDPTFGGNSSGGLKRVFIQYRNGNCESLITHDEINFTGQPVVDNDGDGFDSNEDCDDNDATVFPGATELCDGKDNDCDGQTDEDLSTDGDGDGHFTPGSCASPADDCDDNDDTVFPGAPELCTDAIDNDCDGGVNEDCPVGPIDQDGDGFDETVDCNDLDDTVFPGGPELCDGKDNDCDGQVDEDLSTDADGDGHFTPGSCASPADDCDDNDDTVFPGAPELCTDAIDNDCDGGINEDCPVGPIDQDGDGFDESEDCDDTRADINPDAIELCTDGVDNNCNDLIDFADDCHARCEEAFQLHGPLGWDSKAPLPFGREGSTGVIIGKRIYVTHGFGPPVGDTNTTLIYDIPTNTWSSGAVATVNRSELTGVCVNAPDPAGNVRGHVFAVGGRSVGPLDVVELYDPVSNTWSVLPPMPTPRRGLGAAYVSGVGCADGTLGSVFVMGGSTGTAPHSGTPLAANECFDVQVGVWVARAPMPLAMMDVYSTTYFPATGKIYVIGGFNSMLGGVSGEVQIYDPVSDTWDPPGAPMPTPRSNLISGVCGGKIYAIGGAAANLTQLTTNEVYDPVMNVWGPATAKPTASSEMASQFIYTGAEIFAVGEGILGNAGRINEVFTCEQPLAVVLASFDGDVEGKSIALHWETVSETDTVGFILYRAERSVGGRRAGGAFEPISGIIPSRGSELEGTSYRFVDRDVQPGRTYSYRLEDIDLRGRRTQHGPAEVTFYPEGRLKHGRTR